MKEEEKEGMEEVKERHGKEEGGGEKDGNGEPTIGKKDQITDFAYSVKGTRSFSLQCDYLAKTASH